MLKIIKESFEKKDFGKFLKDKNLNGFGIEIGVWKGDFSEILAKTSSLEKIYLLDPWIHTSIEEYDYYSKWKQEEFDKIYDSVVKRMSHYGEKIKIIRGKSDYFNNFKDLYFDFVYIDANHSYKMAKHDIENWISKVKKDGILSGDDYLDGRKWGTTFGVKSAVDEFCDKNSYELHLTKEKVPQWFIYV